MPPPNLEARDYIGLGPAAPAPSSSSCSSSSGETGPHLALRLGLPGCDEPEAAVDAALTLGPAPATAHAPTRGGAKRGFADSLDRTAAAAGAGGEEDKQKGEATAAGAPPAAK